MGNAGQIARGWVDAWRGFRDNPLARYWNHAEQRRLSVLHWYKRSPGLFALALWLSLGITAWQVLLILRVLHDRQAGVSAFHTDLALIGGTTALIMSVEVFAFCWLLVCGLLLYLARRLDWMRGAIAYALPAVLVGISLLVYAVFAMSGELFEFYGEIFLYGAWAAQFLALTAPITAASSHFDVLIPTGAAAGLQDWRMYLLVLSAQLALLITCAEFARDALRRRKWGREGA